MKHILPAALAIGFATSATFAAVPTMQNYTGHELSVGAKVTVVRARAIAMKARPGKITDFELEKEAGGSGLRYSFDIRSGNKPFEVGIDAMTGRVLENKAEGPHPD